MQLIESSNIPWNNIAKFVPLCIDNDQVRKRIISSGKITIHMVPTILVVRPTGLIEKFEADKAFDWTNDILSQFSPSSSSSSSNHQPIDPPPQKIIPQQSRQSQPPPPQQKKPNKTAVKATSINDIVFEADNEAEDVHEAYENEVDEDVFDEPSPPPPPPKKKSKVKRPPVNMRTDANNYEQMGDFGEEEDAIKQVRSAIKSDSDNGGGGSKGGIMAMAQAMQKSREKEEVTTSQNRKLHPV